MPVISKITGAPFRFWCQKILPAVYDDSLSYYELLCKVVDYLNKVMEDDINVVNLVNELEEFVNNYFNNLDVQQEINNKLDTMAEDGSLLAVIEPYLQPVVDQLNEDYSDFTEEVNTQIEQFNTEMEAELSGHIEEVTASLNDMRTDITEQDNDISALQSQMSNFIDSYSDIQTFTELYSASSTNGLHYINQTIDLSDPYTDYEELDIYWSYNSDNKVIRVKSADLLAEGVYISWYVDKSPDTGIPAPLYIAMMKLVNGNTAHTQLTLGEAYSEEWNGLAASDATRDKSTTASEYTAGEVYKIVGVTYTTSAELTDIRVGYDGTVYPTAGDAVRDQLSSLSNNIYSWVNTGTKEFYKDSEDIDLVIALDNTCDIITVDRSALTYGSNSTSFALQTKETLSGAYTDVVRLKGNQDAESTWYLIPLNAKYLRVVAHTNTNTASVKITFYKQNVLYNLKPLFYVNGAQTNNNWYILSKIEAGRKYRLLLNYKGLYSTASSASLVGIKTGILYTGNSFTEKETIYRFRKSSSDGQFHPMGTDEYVEFTATEDANCLNVYIAGTTENTEVKIFSDINQFSIDFNNVEQGLYKSIISCGPKPFRRLGYFGANGSIQDTLIYKGKLITAHSGEVTGTLVTWNIDNDYPVIESTATNAIYSHVINMYALKNGHILLGTVVNNVRYLYEVASDFTEILHTYNVPQTAPTDENKVSEFYAFKNDDTIMVIYATTGTTYPKDFEVWEYTISTEAMVNTNTLSLDARYIQGGCAVGNICYMMFNKGYISNSTSEPFIGVYDMTRNTLINTIYLSDFMETEGVTFRTVDNKAELIFGENGGGWLYGVLV